MKILLQLLRSYFLGGISLLLDRQLKHQAEQTDLCNVFHST